MATALDQPTQPRYPRQLVSPRDQFRQERAASQDAFRAAQMEQRAEGAALRASQAEGRLAISQEAQALAAQRAEIEARSKELQMAGERAKQDRALTVLNQATGFLRDARGMNPNVPEFDAQLGEMLAGYPDAPEHPSVQKWLEYNQSLRKGVIDREAKAAEERRVRDAALAARGNLPVDRVVIDGVTYAQPATRSTGKNDFGNERITVKTDDGTVTTTRPLVSPVDRSVAGGATGLVASENATALGVPASAPAAVPTPAIPKVGEVRSGWKFKGGDPADRNNWEK